ncbi:MAG: zinc dependent phospholipase C family protein [Lachnospiraceae bacterium]|nr:zinc dependent phospholipase C family protein [Lachnospiraceae bacterium]
MPGFRAHYLFGKESYEKMSNIKGFSPIREYPMSFGLGLQGPDFFFYDPLSHIFNHPDIGTQIHKNRVMAFFSSLMEARNSLIRLSDRRIADAYIAGFIGHYTLDTICHPYIHFRTKKIENASRSTYIFGIHVLLETDIDNSLLLHYMHLRPSQFRTEATIALSHHERSVLSGLLARAIHRTFPEAKCPKWQIKNAMRMVWLVNKLMSDPHALKKKAVRFIDQKLFGHAFISSIMSADGLSTYKDPCNLRHREWNNPWQRDITSREDFYQLFSRSMSLFDERIKKYKMLVGAPLRSRMAAAFDRIRYEKGNGPHVVISHEASEKLYYHNLNVLLEDLGDLSYDSGLPLED